MKRFWLATLLILTLDSQALAGGLEPFPGVNYSSGKAFYFNAKVGRPECMTPLNKDGSLCSSVEGPGKLLSNKQTAQLFKILNEPASFHQFFAKCFIPHHAFVLYNTKGKAVAQVSICFECDRLAIEPSKPKSRSLSQQGERQLQTLCKELGLKACTGS